MKTKEESDLPGAWSAYGRLLQYLRMRAGLSQQELGEAIGYSLEQVASVEQGRRPAKAAFTTAADRVLDARGVLEVLQDKVDRAKLPRFFRNFALIEAEVLSRFSYDPLLVPGLLQTEAYARARDAGDEGASAPRIHRVPGGRVRRP
ncbi:Scr1 family TA system antitoxin-like transcriptional regulator [Streptomyces yerevanensis]|uniref:Scr1 family TA system antitoxin-like transcriptional regulator n=1 Tax=Streptomyces yerevanensis TaxID=66378 RepID=UPI00316AE0B0